MPSGVVSVKLEVRLIVGFSIMNAAHDKGSWAFAGAFSSSGVQRLGLGITFRTVKSTSSP
jgi:hypothetical protein